MLPVSPPDRRSIALQILIGTAFGSVVAVVKLLIDPVFGGSAPFLLTTAGVALAALIGGAWSGVAAATFTIPVALWLLPPNDSFVVTPVAAAQLAAHIATLAVIIALAQTLHTTRSKAHARKESLEVTLSSIGDAVVVTDANGGVRFMNPVAEQLTGWRLRNAFGANLKDVMRLVNEDTRATVESPVDRVIAEGVVIGLANHTVLVRRDGTEVPIDDSAAPIRDAAGKLIGVVLVFRDVTQRRASDTALRRAHEELERANRGKDEFLTILSHELRTPMTAILGWSSMLRMENLDPVTLSSGIEAIYSAAQMQTRLIEEILDMSRIITGKLRIQRSEQRIGPIIDAALDNIRPEADAKKIQLVVASDGEARIWADPVRLQQVVWNLLSNAVKFTPNGGTITLASESRDGQVAIVVSDTGCGIKSEFLPRIFTRFEQQEGLPETASRGLGIGLSLVRHLAEMHGGQVSVHSDGDGRGATFTVTLPAMSSSVSTQAIPAPGDSAFGNVLAGARIVVVDDDTATLDFLVSVFCGAGAECLPAESAEKAMLHLSNGSADLIVSDLMMPGCDGFTLMSNIRKSDDERIRAIPAVALTAATTPQDRNLAYASGYQEFIRKPVEPSEIVKTSIRLLGR